MQSSHLFLELKLVEERERMCACVHICVHGQAGPVSVCSAPALIQVLAGWMGPIGQSPPLLLSLQSRLLRKRLLFLPFLLGSSPGNLAVLPVTSLLLASVPIPGFRGTEI